MRRPGILMGATKAGDVSVAEIIPGDGNVLWLRADEGTYSDTLRTTEVTADASQVKGWEDLSGAGNHATIFSASGPTIQTVSGSKVLRFNNSNTFTLENLLTLTECEGFIVFKSARSSSLDVLLGSAIPASYIAHAVADNMYYVYPVLASDGTPTGLSQVAAVDQTLYLFGWTLDAANSEAYLNDGASDVSAAVGCHFKFDRIGFYNNVNTYNPWGDMYEVIVYDRKLEPEERTQVKAYLNGKYSIY